MIPVLSVKDLTVQFALGPRQVIAVNGLSFDLGPGECLGVVGESGSGKSQSFLAMLGPLARNGSAAGSVRFKGKEILNAPKAQLQRLRADGVEPDAEGYECCVCGEPAVYGAETLMIMMAG